MTKNSKLYRSVVVIPLAQHGIGHVPSKIVVIFVWILERNVHISETV